ncbi:MAG: putative Fe-S cluster assembly protein SufT [Candidatus Binatia bacterium]|nr:putative Fe-S cluster assembly protein SufT [Candidatus Binatia bacterium]
MSGDKQITLRRECSAVLVPSGETITLAAGSTVWITQSLGGSYTVMTDRGYMARIDGHDADALGMPVISEIPAEDSAPAKSAEEAEKRAWDQLKRCFDPEIPVNIVELGLIYDCAVEPLAGGGYKADVHFTLTAQGCGMGEFLKEDIRSKLLKVPGIRDVQVDLVWEPPWNQSRMSGTAKQQLGIE